MVDASRSASTGWVARDGFSTSLSAPQEELTALRNHAEWMKSELEAISKRIEELEKET
jgi:hypothetical protein